VIGSDLYPTILGLCGVRPPEDRVIDGADVSRVLTGAATAVTRPRPLYWRLNMAPPRENLHMALRDGNWKLLASQDFTHLELYNLAADLRETTDRSAAEPGRLLALRQRLEALNAEVEREGPDWWRRLSPDGGQPLPKSRPR
jgi:arylsulfatase A-like enzyme